jgi:hypothetical protein
VAGISTLHEIDTHWSVNDLLDCQIAMDTQADADALAMRKP